MDNTFDSKFIALDISYRLIEALAPIVPRIERNDGDLETRSAAPQPA